MKIPPLRSVVPAAPRMTRRGALKLLAGTLAAGAAGAGLDAAWIEPGSLSITRGEIPCPNLPPSLDGLKACLISDLHYQDPDTDDPMLAKLVRAIGREDADLVLMPGDFIDSEERMIAPLLRRLSGLRARHGVFASLGNHDGWNAGRDKTARLFARQGFDMLVNRHTRLTPRGEVLFLAGTDFVWGGNPDPAAMLRGVPAGGPLVTLVHEPDYFDIMARHRAADLQVSGHTHGGQCRVPLAGLAPVKPLWGRKYIHGHFRRDGANLFVSRGIGTTGLRVRFACPPELVVLTLRSRQAV